MMRVGETGDPRLEALFGTGERREVGVRPIVRLPRRGLSRWVIAAVASLGALLLVWILESTRADGPPTSVSKDAAIAGSNVTQVPPLYIPPVSPPPSQPLILVPQPASPSTRPPQPAWRPRELPALHSPPTYYPGRPMSDAMPEWQQPQRSAAGPAIVIDTSAPSVQGSGSQAGAEPISSTSAVTDHWGGRVRSSGLANRSTTVPQGMLIPAVLETAFDSNQPGLARAIVSRDVRGFDGKRVLIPRGSRLVGEYGSDVAPGQNRALIRWTRLIRTDGVTIALDSPSADTLGRGGVRANVNSHFWGQFGSALLRSVLEIGTGVATRAATGSVIVAAPSSLQSPSSQNTVRYVPTLKVPCGQEHKRLRRARSRIRGRVRRMTVAAPLSAIVPASGVYLRACLAPLEHLFARHDVTDIYINRARRGVGRNGWGPNRTT